MPLSPLEQAAEYRQQAEAASKPQRMFLVLRLDPDWSEGARLFELAANAYRRATAWEEAAAMFREAARCHQGAALPFSAASALTKAGQAQLRAPDVDRAACSATLLEAADMFHSLGKAERAAMTYIEAADAVETADPEAFERLYLQAIELLESEDRGSRALDARQRLLSRFLGRGDFARARAQCIGLNEAHRARHLPSGQATSALTIVLIDLILEDSEQARAHFGLCFAGAYGTDEARTADTMIGAVVSGDQDALDGVRARAGRFSLVDPHLMPHIERIKVFVRTQPTIDDLLDGTEGPAETSPGAPQDMPALPQHPALTTVAEASAQAPPPVEAADGTDDLF